MDSSTKILIGVVATFLVSVGAHKFCSVGANFADTLEDTARYEISNAGINGVLVAFDRDPFIARDAVLSGDVSEDKRNKAIAITENISGVSSARWADDADSADSAEESLVSEDNTEQSADEAVVSECQDDVNKIMEGKNINFRSGSFYVPPSSFKLLDEIVEILKPCSGVRLEVQGHTDLTGNLAVNQSLSQGRADAVRNALIERGLDADKIIAKGYGSSQPIENAKTSAANAKNRRTIFIIS